MTATVSPGHDPGYLTGQVARGGENYYLKAIEQQGEPAGVWLGEGAADLGLVGEIDPEVMNELYTHLTDPRHIAEVQSVTKARFKEWRKAHPDVKAGTDTYREAKARITAEARAEHRLGSALRDYTASTEKRMAEAREKLLEKNPKATFEQLRDAEMQARLKAPRSRAYYDVTFSASKSVSLLHAGYQIEANRLRNAGDLAGADAAQAKADLVWKAMEEGRDAGLRYLKENAGYTREGRSGHKDADGKALGRRTEAREWTIASFRQHLSRDEDPQLHIHNAILNRVKVTSVDPVTGKTKEKWLALEGEALYRNSLAAGFIQERVTMEALVRDLEVRPEWRKDGKAMEILGISDHLRDQYSKRRHTVTKGVAELAKAYEQTHGRPPGAHQLAKMSQFVVLEQRKGKTLPVEREQLLERWEQESVREVRESLAGVPQAVAEASLERGLEPESFDVEQVIASAVEQVQSERAVFHRGHLLAAIAKELPACLGGLEANQIADLLTDLTDQAVATGRNGSPLVSLDAPELVAVPVELTRADGQSVYTRHDATLYATEDQLQREDKLRALAEKTGARTLNPEVIERVILERGLNESQAMALRGIASSGRMAEVLVGPAGTGKSYTMAALSEAWEAGDSGRVIGVAVSQAAANVLAEEGIPFTANMATLMAYQGLIEQGVSNPTVDQYRLGAEDLVIVDEASMTDTTTANQVRRMIERSGAKVLFAGDFEQIGSVGAGGMFRALAEDSTFTYTLEEVKRFQADWEKAASLRLRVGDVDVLADYEARGRWVSGTREQMVEQIHQDWMADWIRGEDSVMVTGSNATAAELASKAREQLIRYGAVDDSITVELRHGGTETRAGVGDRIQLRDINRELVSASGSRYATNRDVVQLTEVHEDGGITVRYDDGDTLRLPAEYVRDEVVLAYAGTLHSVQGRTVDRSRPFAEPGMNRQALHVGMTRGTQENTGYVPVDQAQPDHLARLGEVLANDGSEKAATTVLREHLEASVRIDQHFYKLEDAMGTEASTRFGRVLYEAGGEAVYETATAEYDGKAWNSVVRLARSAEAAGWDAEALLERAVTSRDFEGAKTFSSVIHARLRSEIQAAERAQARADEAMIRTVERQHERAVESAVEQLQAVPAAEFQAVELAGTAAEQAALWQALQLQQAPTLALDWNRVEDAAAAQQAVLQGQQVDPMATAADQDAAALRALREQEALAQVLAMQQLPSLHAGQGDQARADLADERRREADQRASWDWRLRHLEGAEGQYMRDVAHQVLEPRERQLAEELAAAETLPAWAQSLGPLPTNERQREEWLQRAGAVAGYREAHSYTSETDAIGAAPAAGAVDVHTDWNRAWRALGQPEDRVELVGATDAQLRRWAEEYAREEAWAPAYVEPQLQSTSEAELTARREESQARIRVVERTREAEAQAAQQAEMEAEHREAVLSAIGPDGQLLVDADLLPERQGDAERQAAVEARESAARWEDRADEQAAQVQELGEQLGKLETIQGARELWHDHTMETRERAHAAQVELDKRGAVEQDVQADAEQFQERHEEFHSAEREVSAAAVETVGDEAEWDMPEPEFQPEFQEPQRHAAEVEQPVMPEFHAPVEALRDEAEWDMPEPEFEPEFELAPDMEPGPVAAVAEAVAAAAVQPGMSAEQMEQQRLHDQAMHEWAEQEQARAQAQAERRAIQDQALTQAREDIRETQESRPQTLVGPELDAAVDQANSARSIISERDVIQAAQAQQEKDEPAKVQAQQKQAEAGYERGISR